MELTVAVAINEQVFARKAAGRGGGRGKQCYRTEKLEGEDRCELHERTVRLAATMRAGVVKVNAARKNGVGANWRKP